MRFNVQGSEVQGFLELPNFRTFEPRTLNLLTYIVYIDTIFLAKIPICRYYKNIQVSKNQTSAYLNFDRALVLFSLSHRI